MAAARAPQSSHCYSPFQDYSSITASRTTKTSAATIMKAARVELGSGGWSATCIQLPLFAVETENIKLTPLYRNAR
jgi:hypothetical protein